ncbi:hypothetical protein EYF80_044548 [Liparis tanakae]|uniref:Uncharacterized protein n=1 Tax=Liparis tanakae TaxID=230148 RepID=A0A4Z2FWG6_9TELE|nr:hypothetical protein EYF80_044548 [Liparis tanakae]
MNQPSVYVFHGRGDLPPQVEKSQRHVSKREERESSEKRSERAAQSTNKWTYSAVLSFLDPCVLLRGRRVGTWGGGAEGRGSQDRRVQREGESRGSSWAVSQGSRQVKTQHLRLVKEKIHMAEEAGAISHAPDASRLDASGVNTLFSTRVENPASGAFFAASGGPLDLAGSDAMALLMPRPLFLYLHLPDEITEVFNVYFSVVKFRLSSHIWLFRLVRAQLISQLIDASCRQHAWQRQEPRSVAACGNTCFLGVCTYGACITTEPTIQSYQAVGTSYKRQFSCKASTEV